MMNFVPNIVVLDYLTTISKLTPDIEKKAKSYMESGYQRELTYKHDDGSYSAFGNSDGNGSTWLTAYVIKSFRHASKYILIDEAVIAQGLEFLSKVQLPDGSFPEVGVVHDRFLQGGASKGIALTAYTLITFLENQNSSKIYEDKIIKALDFLVKNLDAATDVYSLALGTFALQLAKHKSANSFLDKLEAKAITKNDQRHWEQELEPENLNRWWYQPISLNTEMSAYAMLAYIEAGREKDSVLVMKWLITQRNANGGFTSSQDTVVGLRALSRLAAKIHGGNNNINISINYQINKKTLISLNSENALVLQKFDLPPTARNFDIVALGKGFSILQISYKFNMLSSSTSPRFTLDPKVSIFTDSQRFTLKICTSFIPDEAVERSNMAVMEVEFPSGYVFDSSSMPNLTSTEKVKVNISYLTFSLISFK